MIQLILIAATAEAANAAAPVAETDTSWRCEPPRIRENSVSTTVADARDGMKDGYGVGPMINESEREGVAGGSVAPTPSAAVGGVFGPAREALPQAGQLNASFIVKTDEEGNWVVEPGCPINLIGSRRVAPPPGLPQAAAEVSASLFTMFGQGHDDIQKMILGCLTRSVPGEGPVPAPLMHQ